MKVLGQEYILSSRATRPLLSIALLLVIPFVLLAQTKPTRPRPRATPTPEATNPDSPTEPQDVETLKTDTNLVTVPVIATDPTGLYISDLTKEEFAIAEDGVKQEVAFFAQISAPFHVVLMLDTSASTKEKLSVIQQSASAFVQQLQAADRVKVISFDDEVHDLNEFTSDRAALKAAINKTKSGEGTKVYDAMTLALNSLRRIQGRKAIVIFTDGVDWHSTDSTFHGTVRWLDEEGVIVYPIRYDTRAATERIAREQSEGMSPTLPTSDVLRPTGSGTTVPRGTTPKTFPSDDPIPTTTGTSSKTGPLGLPSPQEILRQRREQERDRDGSRPPSSDRIPEPTTPSDPSTRPTVGSTTTRRVPRPDDSITATLDLAYSTADSYLKTLAEKSGGKLLRADTLTSLPDAFAKIAAELRTQYLLGYYPANKARDDKYRKIKVTASRKDVTIRARPGYLATETK